jgi:methylmalonyl-CoA carboxyltransferase small subunit
VKLKITIDNKTYEVEVEASEPEPEPLPPAYMVQPGAVRVPAPAPAPARSSAGAPAPSSDGPVEEDKVCRSPINGIVVRIVAQEGQEIQAGDVLLVLEAMKMETNITAPAAGKIAKVRVAQGDGVQSGQIVVELA